MEFLPGSPVLTPSMAAGSKSKAIAPGAKEVVEGGGEGSESKEGAKGAKGARGARGAKSKRQRVAKAGDGEGSNTPGAPRPVQATSSDSNESAPGVKESKSQRSAALEEGEEDSKALVVAKALREHLKNNETPMHCGADALPALNAKIADLLRDAMHRAQKNGRKTLKGCDF